MGRKDESLLNLLIRVPWWISAGLAAVSFLVLRILIPLLPIESFVLKAMSQTAPFLGLLLPLFFLLAAIMSAFEGWRKRRMLDSQGNIGTVGSLNWREFEELVSGIFRRKGYFVLENPAEGPDGGVDLRLRKDGKKVYVQCKHWKARQVGVNVVRELYGVMIAKGADEGVVVTYGTFTREAKEFAKDKPISLIDGNRLTGLIKEVQKTPIVIGKGTAAKTCPKCGSEMVLRTAKNGTYAGQKFWGCSRFPECRSILRAAGDSGG